MSYNNDIKLIKHRLKIELNSLTTLLQCDTLKLEIHYKKTGHFENLSIKRITEKEI
jgi:hypothetical protein